MCLKKYPGLNQSGGKLKRKYKHNTLLNILLVEYKCLPIFEREVKYTKINIQNE